MSLTILHIEVDVFLRKPEDLNLLVSTVARLLDRGA
jgi:hypothetical protein